MMSYGQPIWQFKVDGGLSMPITKYGRIDVSKTISMVDDSPVAEYYDKEGHGAAEQGVYYGISVKRKFLNNKLITSMAAGQGINEVNVDQISNYYTTFFDDDYYYVFEQKDYRVTYGYFSVGYHHQLSLLHLTFEPIMGFSSMRFPDYKMTGYLKTTDEYRFDATHRGSKENSRAFLMGIQSAIEVELLKSLLLGISMQYLSSNHDYAIEPKVAGIDSRKRNDTVNYRVFNLGFSLGVQF